MLSLFQTKHGSYYATFNFGPAHENTLLEEDSLYSTHLMSMLQDISHEQNIKFSLSYSDYDQEFKCDMFDHTMDWRERITLQVIHSNLLTGLKLLCMCYRDILNCDLSNCIEMESPKVGRVSPPPSPPDENILPFPAF